MFVVYNEYGCEGIKHDSMCDKFIVCRKLVVVLLVYGMLVVYEVILCVYVRARYL